MLSLNGLCQPTVHPQWPPPPNNPYLSTVYTNQLSTMVDCHSDVLFTSLKVWWNIEMVQLLLFGIIPTQYTPLILISHPSQVARQHLLSVPYFIAIQPTVPSFSTVKRQHSPLIPHGFAIQSVPASRCLERSTSARMLFCLNGDIWIPRKTCN